jgi:hypothetical protein
MVLGVRWRSATSAATPGRGAGDAVASSCASSRRDEDDDVLFVYIHAKGYVGWFGLRPGPRVGTLLGSVAVQVCLVGLLSFPFSFIYLFSVL